MGKGKIVAIIGAAVGIASVLLSLAIPALFSWYHYDVDATGYGSFGIYLTAFGTIVEDMPYPVSIDMVTLVLIGGIMVLAGAGLCIVSGVTEMKPLGIIGGILMIVGPLMLIFDLIGEVSDFAEDMNNMADALDTNVFFGSYSYTYYGFTVNYGFGLWIGFFMAIGGGVVGLIGGVSV